MPFFYVTNIKKMKNILLFIVITFFTALFFYVKFTTTYPVFSIKGTPKAVYRGENGLALTFNIGWGDERAEKILREMEKNSITGATFFLSGSWVERHPHIVSTIMKQGYEIGMLGYSYVDYSELTDAEIKRDISKGEEAFRKAGIKQVSLLRAPTGSFDKRVLKIADEYGLTVVHWSINSEDWTNPGTQRIVKNISKAKAGDIVLLHASDGAIQTAEAIPLISQVVKDKRLKLLTVSELISNTNASTKEISYNLFYDLQQP